MNTLHDFPTRVADGKHEVLLAGRTWITCESKADAQIIAHAGALEFDALEGKRNDAVFAAELEQLSRVLASYEIGFGSRFFARRAKEVRQRLADQE